MFDTYKANNKSSILTKIVITSLFLLMSLFGIASMIVGNGTLLFLIGIICFDISVYVIISVCFNFGVTCFELENNILRCYERKKLKSQHNILNCNFSTGVTGDGLSLMIYENDELFSYPIKKEDFEELQDEIIDRKNFYNSGSVTLDEVEDKAVDQKLYIKLLKKALIVTIFIVSQICIILAVNEVTYMIDNIDSEQSIEVNNSELENQEDLDDIYTDEELDAFYEWLDEELEERNEQQYNNITVN